MKIHRFGVTRFLAAGLMLAVVVMASHSPAQTTQRGPDEIIESLKKQQTERDPVVSVLTSGDAKTPAEWFEVAKILVDREQPVLAKEYLKKILDANLDASQLNKLADRFGTAIFARLAARKELSPEAGKLADAVLAAAGRDRQTPEQLAAYVDQLASSDERTRDKAIVALRESGPAAVAPLVRALTDPAKADQYAQLRRMLASLGSDATRPLLAYLESPDPQFVAQVISALAQIDDRDAALYLLEPYASLDSDSVVREAAAAALLRRVGKLPTPSEAAAILADRAQRYLDGKTNVRQDENGRAVIWIWDAKKSQAVSKTYPAAVARAILAARLARSSLAIMPNDPKIRQLYLLTTCEAASYEGGLDEQVPLGPGSPVGRAAEFGAAELLAALDEAITTGHGPAATAIAEILGQNKTAAEVLNVGAKPSSLVRALRSADRRTRAAAVEAIVQLRPTQAFAGSNYLGESMAFLATSIGTRRAMVAARNTSEARRVGGYLSKLGYEVDTAVSGRQLIKQLLDSADYELVLVDARIDGPPISILVQQLRHDGRTASLPVGILGTESTYKQAERVAREDPLALALVRPHDEQTVRWQVERLKELVKPEPVTPEVRRRQAARVLGQLAALAGTDSNVLDLSQVQKAVLGAARSGETSADAIGVLEKLGTPESQKTLADLASDVQQPIELRQAALDALARNIEQFGILLTTREILQQYDRYNQSASADRATQKILGSILDVLEAGSKK